MDSAYVNDCNTAVGAPVDVSDDVLRSGMEVVGSSLNATVETTVGVDFVSVSIRVVIIDSVICDFTRVESANDSTSHSLPE